MISNLAEEMTAAKTTLHELGEDLEDSEMTETCEKMSDLFRTDEQQLGSLITNSQHFGKLKVLKQDKPRGYKIEETNSN